MVADAPVRLSVSCLSPPPIQDGLLNWISDKLLGPLLAGLVLALVGSFLLARFEEHYRSRRDHLSQSVDAVRTQLEMLVAVSSAYWSGGYDARTSPIQEAEIEYRLADIGALTRICASELWRDQAAVGPGLVASLIGTIVTPEYGYTSRTAQPRRLQHVAAAAAALADTITQSRSDYVRSSPLGKRFSRPRLPMA